MCASSIPASVAAADSLALKHCIGIMRRLINRRVVPGNIAHVLFALLAEVEVDGGAFPIHGQKQGTPVRHQIGATTSRHRRRKREDLFPDSV